MAARSENASRFETAWEQSGLPSFGPNWDAAIAYGLDVTLLLENLTLSPTQRLARLQEVVRFHELLKAARRIDE